VFLVAAEGGGLRAAYFTALVLENLQARCSRFAQHTFVISGVSGGSVGAALFAQALRHGGAHNEPKLPCGTGSPSRSDVTTAARRTLHVDLLSPLLAGLLFPDLLQQFLPLPISLFDRARFLEGALDQAWVEATEDTSSHEVSFYSVWQGVSGAVPALMLNTTNVETGHRMIVSHLSFPDRARTDLPTLTDINPDLNIPLSTAAILSARFPLITPAGTVPLPARRNGSTSPTKARYVDGGYFENSGLATVLDVVEAVRLEAVAGNVRLVIISIETSAAITNYPNTADDTSYPGFNFGELLSPLRALLNTRQARGKLAKLEAERVVKRLGECPTRPSNTSPNISTPAELQSGVQQVGGRPDCVEAEVITFAISPGNVPVPLGWALSEGARSARDNRQRRE
jgi:Patatin-like phospholipase